MHWRLYFFLGLNANVPITLGAAHIYLLDSAPYIATLAISKPTQLWQKNPTVTLIQFSLFGTWIPKTVPFSSLLEPGKTCSTLEKIHVRSFQIFQGLLQRLRWCLPQKGRV